MKPSFKFAFLTTPALKLFFTWILPLSSSDMHQNRATTPPSRVSGMCLIIEQKANRKNNKSASSLLPATPHRQQRYCMRLYILQFSTPLAPHNSIAATTQSLFSTRSHSRENSTNNVHQVGTIAFFDILQSKATKQNGRSLAVMQDIQGKSYYLLLCTEISLPPTCSQKNGVNSIEVSKMASLYVLSSPETGSCASWSLLAHTSHHLLQCRTHSHRRLKSYLPRHSAARRHKVSQVSTLAFPRELSRPENWPYSYWSRPRHNSHLLFYHCVHNHWRILCYLTAHRADRTKKLRRVSTFAS